jgi:AraC-like DNA-binding protein
LRSLAQADSRASRIARAIGVIRRDFHLAIAVADLAQTAAMSLSAFHHHFRAITGLTPLQFQKQLRLTEARRLMLAEDRSIAAAAFAVGYESASQFTREYARQFGAPPRRDLRAAAGRASPVVVATGDFALRSFGG